MSRDTKNWTGGDVRTARAVITAAVPDAEFSESDYGYSLSVRRPGAEMAYWVYYAPRPERGEGEEDAVAADITKVVEMLRACPRGL